MSQNFTLYNCCNNCMEPNFHQFSHIEMHPVFCDEYEVCEPIGYEDAHLATIWSIYGRLKEGGMDCITDVTTEKLAREIAIKFVKDNPHLDYGYGI